MTLVVGDKAPDFTSVSDENEVITLESLRGKNIVLYFYPKDNTPGCTREAIDFRDHFKSFLEKNTEVIGVSKDTPKCHDGFKKKHGLPFHLIADEDGDLCEAYGVLNKKSLFGKTFLGLSRTTFLIDAKGIIRAIWRKVKVKDHVQQVLDELNKI